MAAAFEHSEQAGFFIYLQRVDDSGRGGLGHGEAGAMSDRPLRGLHLNK